jgi:hypothetical protein
MVRHRVRKTHIRSTTVDVMESAANDVVNSVKSLNEAALEYHVPKTTLFRYVAKLRKSSDPASVIFCPRYKSRRIFSDIEESMLVDYLLTASKLHHGLTGKASRELAFEFAQVNKKDMPRNWTLNMTAGEDWFYHFMKRHRELSIRAPQSTSLARSTSFNKVNVNSYFDNLEDVLKRHKFRASDINNVDETGFTTVHVPNKIVAGRGSK